MKTIINEQENYDLRNVAAQNLLEETDYPFREDIRMVPMRPSLKLLDRHASRLPYSQSSML